MPKLCSIFFYFISKILHQYPLSLWNAKIEVVVWELAKAWRHKLDSLQSVSRWRCLSYEKQCQLPAECFRQIFERRQPHQSGLSFFKCQKLSGKLVEIQNGWARPRRSWFTWSNRLGSFFAYQKPSKISKKDTNIIWRSLKNK